MFIDPGQHLKDNIDNTVQRQFIKHIKDNASKYKQIQTNASKYKLIQAN